MDKEPNILRTENRKIRLSVLIFVIGNILFLFICVAMVLYGGYCVSKLFSHSYLKGWEKFAVLAGLGGLVLFFQILTQFFETHQIPKDYEEINESNRPDLIAIINGLKSRMGITKNIRVFLTDECTASVFVLPDIQNIFRNPERYLSIGKPLVESLTQAELKAVLSHELAHFSQLSVKETSRAVSIGLFAKSFLSEKINYEAKYGPGNITQTLMILYYYYLDSLCRFIKRHYARLSDELEFEADQMAIRFVKPQTLCDALLHILRMNHIAEIPEQIMMRIKAMGATLPPDMSINKGSAPQAKIKLHLDHRKHIVPWTDFVYSLLLNGKDIGEGHLLKGFNAEVDMPPDVYTFGISTFIDTLDSKPYTFEVEAGYAYHVELDYKYNIFKSKYTVFCSGMTVLKTQSL